MQTNKNAVNNIQNFPEMTALPDNALLCRSDANPIAVVGQVLPDKPLPLLKGCHSRVPLSGIFHVPSCYINRGFTPCRHPELVSGSSRFVRGFSLIELLVVVLIIGLLAAVALPQYNKAVEKSKIAEGLTLLKSVGQSAQAYYLETGNMPSTFEALNIEVPFQAAITDDSSTIQNLLYGSTFVGQKASNDWGVALLPGKKQVMVFRMNGKYSYKDSLRSGFVFTVISDSGYNNNLPAGSIGCFTPRGGSDYCSNLLGISKTPISVAGYKWYAMS